MGEPSPAGSTLHHLDVHKTLCQGLLLKHRKLSAKSWWEQRAASFEFHRQWEGPGRFHPHPGPPPEHPSLPQCLKPIFQVKHLISLSGKGSRNPLQEIAMPSLCPCLWEREIPAAHHCHTAVTASSSQTELWEKAKLPEKFQTVQQRSVDRACQSQLLSCRGNGKHFLQENPSALPVHS